jgi:hypothetical protein
MAAELETLLDARYEQGGLGEALIPAFAARARLLEDPAGVAAVPSHPLAPFTDRLRLAVAAYLARFKGSSRQHTESDLRCYLSWCAEHGLDPLAAQRPHLELYIRWMQEIRRFRPSTVSRRFSATAGFYRTCALDGVLPHSPAEHVRRPLGARRITDPGIHPPAVRGPAYRRP